MAGVLLSVSTGQMHSVLEKLTGLKGDKCEKHTTLQSFLKGGVASIVGFGGLGKASHANEVYRNLQRNLSAKVFLSVAQRPGLKQLHDKKVSCILSARSYQR
ncbi:hypothetical protein C2845_PM18G03200 [Panicum miliaceum]|uniref:Uncharacterized protein n=1 Tax=Panicum miliaceum TaxID=4540 RepID=A0A3L6PFR6_PANMI|nr:hypothetical protein C2845_PM18G03200 [Panicum miliaceum]